MKNKIEWIKQYDEEYCNIVESVEGDFFSKRQINRKIARKWNVPYDVIQDLSKESDKISEELKNAKQEGLEKEIQRLKNDIKILVDKEESDVQYESTFCKWKYIFDKERILMMGSKTKQTRHT